VANWEYWVDNYQITERWSTKKQAEEIANFRNALNSAGKNGWELVGYEAIPVVGGWSGNVKGYAYLVMWKRPLTDGAEPS
jgi:hypothetical protein